MYICYVVLILFDSFHIVMHHIVITLDHSKLSPAIPLGFVDDLFLIQIQVSLWAQIGISSHSCSPV